ncbi:hypothetical protein AGMMS49957_02840 [Synergistales bacterium]|nr:hypothetical protein AGMMS49957_02840 [Synergistales bacterium]
MFKKEDWIFGLIAIAVGALTLYLIKDLASVKSMDPAGPVAMPSIVAWLMIAIGVVHVAGAVMKKNSSEAKSEENAGNAKKRKSPMKVVTICVACAIYYFALESAGYIVMTPPLIVAIMLGVGERNMRRIISTSIFTTAFLFCVFYYALKVNMPLGVLESFFN